MKRNIIYIINPISGTRTKKDLQLYIEKRTAEMNISFQIFPSVASGDYSFLHAIIKEQQVTDVVIAGGDGTVSQVVSSLMDCGVNFGIIPCGSGNGLAYAAKIPKQPAKALDIIFNGSPSITDGFYFNKQFACMLCGLGFDAKVAHDFAEQPKRGLVTYVKQVIKNFFSAKPYRFEIILDDKKLEVEAFFISIANSNQFGNNFTIAPQASLHDGLLDIVVVNRMSKLRMIWTILKQVRNGQVRMYEDKKYHQNDIHYFQAKKITIKNPELAPLHIDGDPAATSNIFEIEIIENAFKLLIA
jgi:diacylglycerol kinase (ATP)